MGCCFWEVVYASMDVGKSTSSKYLKPTTSTVPGLPAFCKGRHRQSAGHVYSVPLWEFPSSWTPQEIAHLAPAPKGGDTPHVEAVGPAALLSGDIVTPLDVDEGDNCEGQSDGSEGVGGCDIGEASESEQSEVRFEGELSADSRVWSRGANEGALLLMRRIAVVGVSDCSAYGVGLSAALFPPGAIEEGDEALDRRLAEVLQIRAPRWAVFALCSGRFSGAIFHGPTPIRHKVFRRYTIRAKSGGAQSACDSGGGRKPKSAGSNLRRYGEQRLEEEIRNLLTQQWSTELASCELIFVSVSKRMRSTLLGSESHPYVDYRRVRRLPFAVPRPTFQLVQAAYMRVASVIFAQDSVLETLTAQFHRPPPADTLVTVTVEPKPKQKVAPVAEPPREKYREEEDDLYTPLHAAAATGSCEDIVELLDAGANPEARDGKGRAPYYLCMNQRARDTFRRWRGNHEEEWDWDVARVPEGITEETEKRQKEKEREKKKRQRAKQKENKLVAKQEEAERQRKEEEEAEALKAAQLKCQFCGKAVLAQPFSRMEFFYCSTECVRGHQRKLQADAAAARFSSNA